MTETIQYSIAALVGYLLGAIPVGYLVARAKGINIFEHGSKNPGATNVKRVLGKGPGNTVFALDFLKGSLATAWPLIIGASTAHGQAVCGIIGALLGHSFSCFTKFRGGKGVATAGGALIVILPASTTIALALWVAFFYLTRYVSVASIIASIALPGTAWILHTAAPNSPWLLNAPLPFCILSTCMGAFIILRHRANIKRLLNGTENKFVKKSPEQSSTS